MHRLHAHRIRRRIGHPFDQRRPDDKCTTTMCAIVHVRSALVRSTQAPARASINAERERELAGGRIRAEVPLRSCCNQLPARRLSAAQPTGALWRSTSLRRPLLRRSALRRRRRRQRPRASARTHRSNSFCPKHNCVDAHVRTTQLCRIHLRLTAATSTPTSTRTT